MGTGIAMRANSPAFLPLPRSGQLLPLPPSTPTRSKLIYIHPPQPLARLIPSFKARPAVLALAALTLLSLFTLSHSFLSTSFASPPIAAPKYNLQHLYANTSRNRATPSRKQISLSAPEELAAIIQFISVHPSNALPLSVDPSRPVDPQLICGFDTRSENARHEVDEMVEEVWARHPIVLFRGQRSSGGREVNSLLDSFETKPAPVIINIDDRSDTRVLSPILSRLTTSERLPILLIGGNHIPTDDILALKQMDLKQRITEAGAVVGGAHKKKKGK